MLEQMHPTCKCRTHRKRLLPFYIGCGASTGGYHYKVQNTCYNQIDNITAKIAVKFKEESIHIANVPIHQPIETGQKSR